MRRLAILLVLLVLPPGVAPALTDVFGERFRAARLRKPTPGERVSDAAAA
jgi:hypothetical protein